MATSSVISLVSAIISVLAILVVLSIFRKVYQEDYKKPWLFIGISALFLAFSQLLTFLSSFYSFVIINSDVTDFLEYVLDFIAISILTYGLFLESMILKFIKGKFVKFKFVPVQEGTIGGDIDLNVSNGVGYLALKKDRNFLLEQFALATKKGFEGFLIVEESPSEIREKYNLEKTPIAWIKQFDDNIGDYVKKNLDSNSDIVEPINLNNLITFIDNFLEQSQNPFVLIELNEILKSNNFSITTEFLEYIKNHIVKYNGILIYMVNGDILDRSQLSDLQSFLIDL